MSLKKNYSMTLNGICLSDNQSVNSSNANVNNMTSIQNENTALKKEIEKQSKIINELLEKITYYKREILKLKNNLITLNTNDILYKNEEINRLELERLTDELQHEKELNMLLKTKNKSLISHNTLMKEQYKKYTGNDFN